MLMPTARDVVRQSLNDRGIEPTLAEVTIAAAIVQEGDTPTEAWAKLEAEIGRLERAYLGARP